jgi:hypothetical protein
MTVHFKYAIIVFKSDLIFTTADSLGAGVGEIQAHQTRQFSLSRLALRAPAAVLLRAPATAPLRGPTAAPVSFHRTDAPSAAAPGCARCHRLMTSFLPRWAPVSAGESRLRPSSAWSD